MATFLRHTSCKRCGSSDANAVYSDDSEFCFSCQHSSGAKKAVWVDDEETKSVPPLPDDLSKDFPQAVIDFLKPTGITLEELIRNDYAYSQKTRWLFRILENQYYECRKLAQPHYGPKTKFFGSKQLVTGLIPRALVTNESKSVCQFMHPHRSTYRFREMAPYGCGNISSRQSGAPSTPSQDAGVQQSSLSLCCLVEDSLSAIKVARLVDAIPLFGSSINNEKLARIVKDYQRVYVWLDEDKFTTAQSIALRVQLLGKDAKVVYSKLDPKYVNAQDYIK